MRLLIVGTGYVGLVTGTCCAEMGHEVTCLDIDEKKIALLKSGKSPIYEPGLEELLERNIKAKRLKFTTNYKKAVKNNKAIFLALPTPSSDDGSCNISYLKAAVTEISKYLDEYKLIINKSTATVGTVHKLKEHILKENPKAHFDVASNPEFLKEGSAILDCMKPDRIIIGAETKKALSLMHQIYEPFMLRTQRIIEMDILSAELTKYAANAMLASRISFMNELSQICKRAGANINHVRHGMGSDLRIGNKFLYPGIGYGGSCFPKDIRALIHLSKSLGHTPHLLEAVESVNEVQKKELSNKMKTHFEKSGGVKGKTIAIWGLSFKPDTDDMRDAPSLTIIKELIQAGAHLRVYDPVAMDNAKELLKDLTNITFCENEQEAAHKADAVALLTEWKQFRLINFDPILKKLNQKVLFDGRNQYKPDEMKKKGFKYFCIGVSDLDKS